MKAIKACLPCKILISKSRHKKPSQASLKSSFFKIMCANFKGTTGTKRSVHNKELSKRRDFTVLFFGPHRTMGA